MAEPSLVAVFAVDEGGVTGDRLGWATLVEPGLGLALRPLNEELAARPRSLRTGVRSAFDAGVEVIDVAAVHVLDGAADLVVLTLAHESLAEPTPLGVGVTLDPDGPELFVDPSRAQVVAALRSVLDAVAAPKEPEIPAADPVRFIRRVLGLHP